MTDRDPTGVTNIVQTYIDENLFNALQGTADSTGIDTTGIGARIGGFVDGLLSIDPEKPMTREVALAKVALIASLLGLRVDLSIFDK
jgi:hypothetical protein